MSLVEILVRGAVVGLAVAAPVGPIGVLVIRRSVADGRAAGLATGMGAACADAIFALLGGLGVASIAPEHAGALRIAGAIALVAIAARMLRARPADRERRLDRAGLARAFASTLALTLTSPVTIASFAAIAASVGVAGGGPLAASALSLGVLAGSSAWWLVLSAAASLARSRIDRGRLVWLDRGSAAILVALAIAAAWPLMPGAGP